MLVLSEKKVQFLDQPKYDEADQAWTIKYLPRQEFSKNGHKTITQMKFRVDKINNFKVVSEDGQVYIYLEDGSCRPSYDSLRRRSSL